MPQSLTPELCLSQTVKSMERGLQQSARLKRWIKAGTPWPVRRFLRRLFSDLASIPARLKKDAPKAPWKLAHDSGGGDHAIVSRKLTAKILKATAAPKSAAVLDVGCGDGRVAAALAGHLDEAGSYVGFDVSRAAIKFCNKSAAASRPNFRFVHADIANREYNPVGKIKPCDYRFPVEPASRDLLIATSLFTHLLPDDVTAYFREIARVLKKDGVAYVTAYLIDDAARERLAAGAAPFVLAPLGDGVWATDVRAPEAGTGYDETLFLRFVEETGLRVRELKRGTWSHGGAGWDHQDVVLLTRRDGP
jgi:SAM-dependent methyltransferase